MQIKFNLIAGDHTTEVVYQMGMLIVDGATYDVDAMSIGVDIDNLNSVQNVIKESEDLICVTFFYDMKKAKLVQTASLDQCTMPITDGALAPPVDWI